MDCSRVSRNRRPGRVGFVQRPAALRGRPPVWATLLGLWLLPQMALADPGTTSWNGRRIMVESGRRHQVLPYVFEEQTLILTDAAGNRDVRKARRFSRVEEDGTFKYLLVFDNPPEVRGVSVLAVLDPSGELQNGIYLPAFGKALKRSAGDGRSNRLLGTDFTVSDLMGENPGDYRYQRKGERRVGGHPCFVVDAYPRTPAVTGPYGLLRHLVRKDNLYVVRTDYFDRQGRFLKRQSRYDLRQVDGDLWRANMILMEDAREGHMTLIKIDNQVFSRDYVPARMFTPEWLLSNRHLVSAEKRLFANTAARDSGAAKASPPVVRDGDWAVTRLSLTLDQVRSVPRPPSETVGPPAAKPGPERAGWSLRLYDLEKRTP